MSIFIRPNLLRKKLYEAPYYSSLGPIARKDSAGIVVPIVASFVQPRTVIDVGCGSGAWLRAFREHGADRILGLDGDHIDPAWLVIPKECFRSVDFSRPFHLDEKFDLAVCLEVAEHLPKAAASGLIQSLVGLAPIVLFSAAIPFQDGTYHVNEQWPQYWERLFWQHRYKRLDLIRKHIWKNPDVEFWYRQNMFLFVQEDLIRTRPAFAEAAQYAEDLQLVHISILEEHLGLLPRLKHVTRSIWEMAKLCLKILGFRRPRGTRTP